jgi:hypothetical protein
VGVRPLRKVQRAYHRAQADRLAGAIMRSLEAEGEAGVDARLNMYVRRYNHLTRLDNA